MSAAVEASPRPAPSASKRPGRIKPAIPLSYLVALVIIAITLVPMLYVIIGGFRTTAQLNVSPTGLPHPWVWANYKSILTSASFWQNLGNSAFIALVVTALAVGLGSMASFALARYHFRGREFWYMLFAIGLLFPANVASLPVYLLDKQIHLLDNWIGIALPEAAFSLPITIIILRPFMRAIPGELEDAAVVDGASRFTFFLRVLIPLSRPALMTVAILAFVTSWNAYLLPLLVFTTPSHFTLPLGVATFQSTYSQDTASVFAFTALSMLPALAFFALAQRRIVGGLSGLSGSIRG
ncbi:MAG TPA: carbohydrate ABC transporter permease [Streptosporangiaceae bacterium]|nr:carbohydrate ABC transporter permease [Streptosporangiaceae bacterium]